MAAVDLKTKIRDVPDFPQPGIVFKDIMPLLADEQAFAQLTDELAAWAEERDPDVVLASAGTGERHPVDGGVRGPRETLEEAEPRQAHAGLTRDRAPEGVAPAEPVVHMPPWLSDAQAPVLSRTG